MSLNAAQRVCVSLCFPLPSFVDGTVPPPDHSLLLLPSRGLWRRRRGVRAACLCSWAAVVECTFSLSLPPSLRLSSPRLLDRWSGGRKVTPRRSNTASSCASRRQRRAGEASVLPRLASLPRSLCVLPREGEGRPTDSTPTTPPMHSPRLILFNADRVNV